MRTWTEIAREAEEKTNERACACYLCSERLERGAGLGVFVPSRGQRYICSDCDEKIRRFADYHYSAENGYGETLGTAKTGKIESVSVGVEFEVMGSYIPNDRMLLIYLWELGVKERDCSVDYEFPSRPMQGLKTLSKFLEFVENGGFLPAFNNGECGAHVHACLPQESLYFCREYYSELFTPLCRAIQNMGGESISEYFGRDFSSWAEPISSYTYIRDKYNFINVNHDQDVITGKAATLEFRLPRITGAHQYVKVVKYWRETVYTIQAATDWSEAGVAKTAEKLVKILTKYFPS